MARIARAAGLGVGALLVIGLVGLMAWGLSTASPVTSLSGLTRVQQQAPEFTLPLFDGGELVLTELRGRPVVINFWASWCAPCVDEAPDLERTWRRYMDDDVVFIGVDIQDGDESAQAFIDEFDITYPNGHDDQGRITVDYGVIGIPVTFFVNRGGTIERRWVGAIDESRLVRWVDDLIAGVPPSDDAEGENLEGFFELAQDE